MDLKKTFGIRSISFNSSYMLNHSVWLLVWTAQRAEHTYLISSAKYLDVSYFLTPGVFAIFLQTFFKGIVFKSISFSSFKSISYSFDLEVWFHFERNCPSDLKSSLSFQSQRSHFSVLIYMKASHRKFSKPLSYDWWTIWIILTQNRNPSQLRSRSV